MFDDMGELEILVRMERYYGPLSKRLPAVYTTDAMEKIQEELLRLINKYKTQLRIQDNIPRIRIWIEQNAVRFMFFDRHTGKRVLLGEWLGKSSKDNVN